MARKRKHTGPHIFWRNGRAYADLRAYADVGGGREALSEPDSTLEEKQRAFADAQTLIREAKKRIGTPPPRK